MLRLIPGGLLGSITTAAADTAPTPLGGVVTFLVGGVVAYFCVVAVDKYLKSRRYQEWVDAGKPERRRHHRPTRA